MTFQVALVVKNLPANAAEKREPGLIPRWGRSPGGGHGNPLQYSCLENSMDRGAWWAVTVHGVAKTQTWLSSYHFDCALQRSKNKWLKNTLNFLSSTMESRDGLFKTGILTVSYYQYPGTVVPNLFGTRHWFLKRQFFHRPGQGDGFNMIQVH